MNNIGVTDTAESKKKKKRLFKWFIQCRLMKQFLSWITIDSHEMTVRCRGECYLLTPAISIFVSITDGAKP